ncbi:MAG TPA: hypothetical protein VGK49_08200 [Ilumatobacteraceae bacterium]
MFDLAAATAFMATHARLLDRRRFELLVDRGRPDAALDALEGYRNADGGYGWGLEPDLRSPESQPAGALHALEVFAEVGPTTAPRAAEVCDWLASASLDDGGLPFAVPVTDPAGCAPFWAGADSSTSSLHITAAVCSIANRVAAHDPAVAAHPWLASATEFCLGAIERLTEPHAIELMYVLHFLDSLVDHHPDAHALLERTARNFLPADGSMHVAGGLEDERLLPLDFSPRPDRPLRALVPPDAIAADLERWRSSQQDDGGWVVDFASSSPVAALEWRGYATVRAITLLIANDG